MDSLNTLARDTELKYTKKLKHAKQIKLRKILAKKNTNKKLPVQHKVQKAKKHNYSDSNVITLLNIFLDYRDITSRKQYLYFNFQNGRTKLTSNSQSELRNLNLLRKLNLGYSTDREVKMNKDKHKCYISYNVHLNDNFYKAMNLITKKLHRRIGVKTYHILDSIGCSFKNFFDKHHSKLMNLFDFSPIALATIFSIIMGFYVGGKPPIPALILFSLFTGIILTIGFFMVSTSIIFGILLVGIITMSVVDHNMSKSFKNHKKLIFSTLSKFTKQSPSKVLNILTNHKS